VDAAPDSIRDVGGTEQEYAATFYISTEERAAENIEGRGGAREPSYLVRRGGRTYTITSTEQLGDGILILQTVLHGSTPPDGVPTPEELTDDRVLPRTATVEVTTPTPEVRQP
jgi:hypothetical protein